LTQHFVRLTQEPAAGLHQTGQLDTPNGGPIITAKTDQLIDVVDRKDRISSRPDGANRTVIRCPQPISIRQIKGDDLPSKVTGINAITIDHRITRNITDHSSCRS